MNADVLLCSLLACVNFWGVAGAVNKDKILQEILRLPTNLGIYDEKGALFMITNVPNRRSKQTNRSGRITFTLYTRQNPTEGQVLDKNTASVSASDFDAKKETYMITHGWRNSGHDEACTLIRDAYLTKTDSNVIVVDWSNYSMSIWYIDVSYKVERVGRKVGRMIKLLYFNGLRSNHLTLIGHSLGAHVMGIAGHNVRPKVGRIIGLDPALQMFRFAEAGEALTMGDAKHVQIIHTNAGGLGYLCPNGHTDFFPNGGVQQAGCCRGNPIECASCSHSLAYKYFAESISKTFVATKCDSYESFEDNDCGDPPYTAPMGGLDLDNVEHGTYYLRTSDTEPFSEIFRRNFDLADLTEFFTDVICDDEDY